MQMIKQALRRTIRRLGYDVMRYPQAGSTESVQPSAAPARGRSTSTKLVEAEDAIRRETEARVQADFYYYIDIVGSCNLRCPSCPVGNYAAQMPKGLMRLDKYKQIVEKIIAEHPGERIFIDLYNWGEPILHKQLPEIIW